MPVGPTPGDRGRTPGGPQDGSFRDAMASSGASAASNASRAAADIGGTGAGGDDPAVADREGSGPAEVLTTNSVTPSPKDRAASSNPVAASRSLACQTGESTR